jgi:hypothetical protein
MKVLAEPLKQLLKQKGRGDDRGAGVEAVAVKSESSGSAPKVRMLLKQIDIVAPSEKA